MIDYEEQAKYFKVLGHPIRLAILELLRIEEQCVCHMEAAFGLRQALISQHLMVLREVGFVQDRREGWNIYYMVTSPEIFQVLDAMSLFCGKEVGLQQSSLEMALNQPGCACPRCKPEVKVKPATRIKHPSVTGEGQG